jgi:hypothetical protein
MNPKVRAKDGTDQLQASVEQAPRPSDAQIRVSNRIRRTAKGFDTGKPVPPLMDRPWGWPVSS